MPNAVNRSARSSSAAVAQAQALGTLFGLVFGVSSAQGSSAERTPNLHRIGTFFAMTLPQTDSPIETASVPQGDHS